MDITEAELPVEYFSAILELILPLFEAADDTCLCEKFDLGSPAMSFLSDTTLRN
jgi:hypothetical protein